MIMAISCKSSTPLNKNMDYSDSQKVKTSSDVGNPEELKAAKTALWNYLVAINLQKYDEARQFCSDNGIKSLEKDKKYCGNNPPSDYGPLDEVLIQLRGKIEGNRAYLWYWQVPGGCVYNMVKENGKWLFDGIP